jgi:peroxin-4
MTFKPGELYHPNVNRETGEICADMISKTWGPTQNVTTLAKLVLGFLETPNMESPLDGDCAAELAASVDKYEASARKYAEKAPKKGSV